jgi:hypothetical protein
MPFPLRIPRIPFMQQRPEFPSVADLPNLSPADATRALAALRCLVDAEQADVYSSAGSHDTRWNVWDNAAWRRVPLGEWATQWLAEHDGDSTPPGGGAA